jgi:hypothetical protein
MAARMGRRLGIGRRLGLATCGGGRRRRDDVGRLFELRRQLLGLERGAVGERLLPVVRLPVLVRQPAEVTQPTSGC